MGLLWNSPLPIHIAKISMCHLGGGGGGVILGGLGAPQLLANNTFFSGFSHTTDRKVPSEVVILCQSYMVMSNKTAIYGITATPSIGSPALPLLLGPPNFQMEITPLVIRFIIIHYFKPSKFLYSEHSLA